MRKYDPKTGKVVGEVPRTPEAPPGGGGGSPAQIAPHTRGRGAGAVAGFLHRLPGAANLIPRHRLRGRPLSLPSVRSILDDADDRGRTRRDPASEPARELYCADNYLGGRVMVFDLDTLQFKRGWGAYGHTLAEMTTSDADRAYTPNGPTVKNSAI